MLHLARRRFWKHASAEPGPEGHRILLDGRPVRTPAKTLLVVPSAALAAAIAAEWQAQGEEIDPDTMPLTRRANAALDKVTCQRDEVVGMLADYAASDLLCHRAETPQELVRRQTAAWDPYLDWAADSFGARLVPAAGLMPRPQDASALAALRAPLEAADPFRLTALHDLITLTGSLVLGLAAAARWRPAEQVWRDSRIDEDWQIAQWGEDDEARAMTARRQGEFMDALRFLELVEQG